LFGLLGTPFQLIAQEYLPDVSVLANKTYGERTLILTPFYEQALAHNDSTTIFSKIKEVEILAEATNDYDLTLEAAVMQVHYYYYRYNQFPRELVIDKLLDLDRIAKDQDILWLEIRVQNLLANYLFVYHKEYARGFEHFERSGQLLENISSEDFPLKQICLYQIGEAYYKFKQYSETVNYLRKASQESSRNTRYYYKQGINNTLGLSYRELQHIDSSDFYFNKVLSAAKIMNDSVWIGIVNGNLGYNRYLDKDFSKAIELFNSGLTTAIKTEQEGIEVDILTNLAQIAFENDEITKADRYAIQAKNLIYRSNELYRLEKLYPLLAKIKSATNESRLATVYIDSTTIIKDSIAKAFDARILTRAKQRVVLEQIRSEELQKEQEAKNNIAKRNMIIIILIAAMGIIVLLYNRNRLKAKHRAQQLALQKDMAMSELKSASKRLEVFKQSIVDKNKTLEHIEDELQSTKLKVQTLKASQDANTYHNQNTIIKKLQESAILTDKDWRNFVTLFTSVYPDFFLNLKNTYPDITTAETRVIALSKLQLQNKEMALILGVGTGSIRQTKLRIRKKMQLTTDAEFLKAVEKI